MSASAAIGSHDRHFILIPQQFLARGSHAAQIDLRLSGLNPPVHFGASLSW
jgi:hypothetical protein